jgi:hypothetical protein
MNQQIVIIEVTDGSPGALAGFCVGDVVVSYANQPLLGDVALFQALQGGSVGRNSVAIEVRRGPFPRVLSAEGGPLGVNVATVRAPEASAALPGAQSLSQPRLLLVAGTGAALLLDWLLIPLFNTLFLGYSFYSKYFLTFLGTGRGLFFVVLPTLVSLAAIALGMLDRRKPMARAVAVVCTVLVAVPLAYAVYWLFMRVYSVSDTLRYRDHAGVIFGIGFALLLLAARVVALLGAIKLAQGKDGQPAPVPAFAGGFVAPGMPGPAMPGPAVSAPAPIGRAHEDVVVAVPGSGGIIGLFVSDVAKINQTIKRYNGMGYRYNLFTRDVGLNLPYRLLQVACLMITLCLWCPSPAGLLFFQRQ